MNNTVLRIISAILAAGALGVAYLAIQLSKAPAAPTPVAAAPVAAPKATVVVATRDVPAGQVLSSTDVALTGVEAIPAQAYTQLQDVVGRTTSTAIQAKTTLLPSHFAQDTLANLLKPGERAVAVQVDEVVGVGGFAQPGEHVDVLAFLPKDGENQGSAQTVVEDARLLTVGEASALDTQANHASSATETLTRDTNAKAATEKMQRQNMRSAVLAVREDDVNRLMLAANAGVLRLALRPLDATFDPNASLSKASKANARATNVAKMSDLGHRSTGGAQPRSGRKLVVQEGRQERELTVDKRAPQ